MKNVNLTALAQFVLPLLAALAMLRPSAGVSQDNLLKPTDFSNTNFVSVSLGEGPGSVDNGENGLRHPGGAGGDSRTTFTSMEGVPCRCLDTTVQKFPKAYFRFNIDPTFKGEEVSNVKIDVEYFDGFEGHAGVFGLQYDATGVGKGLEPKNQACYPNVPLRGSSKWLKATFHIKDATFKNSQTGGGDFRLWASPPELCVKRVTVTLEPEHQAPKETALAFNADGEGKLGEWNVQWDSGTKPSFASNIGSGKGPRWLEVRTPGSFGVGSWRTTALLEPGDYQFVGKARTQGLAGDGGGQPGGVSLRISFRWNGTVVTEAADWTPLAYDFTLPSREYVELICEVRGSDGSARFDPDSLKLIRRGLQHPP
jgi:hypothetical protein